MEKNRLPKNKTDKAKAKNKKTGQFNSDINNNLYVFILAYNEYKISYDVINFFNLSYFFFNFLALMQQPNSKLGVSIRSIV